MRCRTAARKDGTMEKKLLIEVEAEKSVLAAAILDPSVFPAARGILRPIDFGRSAHQVIWKAMEGIADQGEPIDQLTLKHFLDTHGALEQIGGASYILDLASCSVAITNWASHARIVKTMSVLNQLERVAALIDAGVSAKEDPASVIEQAMSGIAGASKQLMMAQRPISAPSKCEGCGGSVPAGATYCPCCGLRQ